ncbi:class I SAM-dependent methyltransferase [Serratia ureilytica]|uniref:class I SAM-dependent methyltransferase n=1 Tax=Serratia ureilytica TaxID=300181 RepID=UPI001E5311C4|nr:class I SAM-dependent methyltransferase [Serratia ureilytica]
MKERPVMPALDGKSILDMCCGSRMFWFDRTDPRVVFGDIRDESHALCDGRELHIKPDVLLDFRALPFNDEQFSLVVFDPPHLEFAGETSWLRAKYGVLNRETWRDDLAKGFSEAFRVLKPMGTLIFKWNETQIKTSEILALTDQKPAFGHPSGKRANTHWIAFFKDSFSELEVRDASK